MARSDLTLGFLRRRPEAAAEVLETMETASAAGFLRGVPARLAAPVTAAMLPFHAARCLEAAGEDFAAGVLPAMPAAAAAAVSRRLPAAMTERLLERIPARTAFRLRLLLRYPATVVGAWMDPGVPVLPAGITVCDAWDRLREEAEALDRYLYVVDREQRLRGRLAAVALLRADNDMPIDRLVAAIPESLPARGDLAAAIDRAAWRECDPLPVLSRDGRFLGVAHHAILRHAETGVFEGRHDSALAEGLMELMETYWTGLSRLIEAPFSLPPRTGSGKE